MASTENNVVTNGNGVDSDEEDLSKMRPVDIDQDVREMERRKRVWIKYQIKNTNYWYQVFDKSDLGTSNNVVTNFNRLKL